VHRSRSDRVCRAFAASLLWTFCSIAGAAITDDSLTFLGVQAGRKDTLSSVTRRLGKTEEWHTGDASTSESKICYRIKTGEGDLVVVFASNSEMANPQGQINHIRVYASASTFSQRKRCASLSVGVSDLKTTSGLRVGVSPDEVQTTLGPKRIASNQSLTYSACSKQYLRKADPYFDRWVGKSECFENPSRPYFNDCSFVEFKFNSGRATYMSLSRNQSVC